MLPNTNKNYKVKQEQASSESDALLLAAPKASREDSIRSSFSAQSCRRTTMHVSRKLAIGALLFTIAIVSLVSYGSSGYVHRSLGRRKTKSDEKKFKKQLEKAEEAEKRVKECQNGDYSKETLKLAYELPFSALFKDNRGQKKFEASSVIVVGDYGYAVCDNSWAITKFGSSLDPFSTDNVLIGDPNREEEDSGYEALLYDQGIFYVVRESVLTSEARVVEESYHAIIEELNLDVGMALDYTVVNSCKSEFKFEGDSKGFEGAVAIHDSNNEMVILGLCEGNFCSESGKDKPGNGRLIAMTKSVEGDACIWKTVKEIKIPKSAYFRDYSAITMNDEGRVAITTQEDSLLWIGHLKGLNKTTGLWDVDQLEFDNDKDDYQVLQFPKNTDCHTIYCNIEGIHWLDNNMLMAVSDKMKSKGKQDFRCFDKDQSVHAFVVP